MLRNRLVVIGMMLCLPPVIFVVGNCQRQPTPTADSAAGSPSTDSEPSREMILGTWEDDYKGHRTFTVRDDGTATMVVELKGMSARLYAKKMTFDEEWSIKDGRVAMKMVGGEPKSRVKLIMKAMGDSTEQEILELTSDRMHLLDPDGKTKYDWRRVHP